MKAMILAAGKGERMLPLTNDTPKPLLKIHGKPMIEHHLEKLAKVGVREVVINVSYKAEAIIKALGDGSRFNLNIIFSYEEGEPLGTGGGIYQALKLLGDEPFLLVSSDIVTDYDFSKLLDKTESSVHLVMVKNPIFHAAGDYGLDTNGHLTLTGPHYTYASFGVINPVLFKHSTVGTFSLAPLFVEAIKRGDATGELYDGDWFNVGTPEQLQQLENA